MKYLKLAILLPVYAFLGWISVGCGHAQVKPTTYQVTLSWTAPTASGSWTGCTTSAPCTYVASRITVTGTTCPAPNVTTPNYTPLNSATPATTPGYTDTTAAGLSVCYLVQTEQGTAVSNPSNTAGPFVVPASPLAPALTGNQTTAEVNLPLPSGDTVAPVLTAKLIHR